MSDEIKSWLVEALNDYRRDVAPESAVDVERFATFFNDWTGNTIFLDMPGYYRDEGKQRKKLNKRIKLAEKSNSVERHARLVKERSERHQPKPNERRPIDETAEEIIFLLMAFHKLLTEKIPGRSISGHTGKPSGRFNKLANFVFEIYGLRAKPDSVQERLSKLGEAERKAMTTEEIDHRVKLAMGEW